MVRTESGEKEAKKAERKVERRRRAFLASSSGHKSHSNDSLRLKGVILSMLGGSRGSFGVEEILSELEKQRKPPPRGSRCP